MEDQLLNLAATIIGKADKDHPADLVMREQWRVARGNSRVDAGRISAIVFAYYRWLGWLDQRRPVTAQLKRALDLDGGFLERPESFSDEKLVEKSIPAWTAAQINVTPEWVRTLQSPPRLWLRARPGQAAALANCLHITKKSPLQDALLYLGESDLFRTREFRNGAFEIQDLASQAVGHLCAPQSGETWWDACAGEGGKTLHLSDLMGNQGLIWASDRAEWRLKKLQVRAARAKCFNYRSVFWDGGPKPPTKTRFDGILVDAPCSGTGTWQRNPHARWTTTMQDVTELAEVQKRLLTHAARSLKPGGRLIYSVCTLTRAETVEVFEHINQTLPELETLPLPNPFARNEPAAPVCWLWPQARAGNGMFIAAWRLRPPCVPS